MQNGNHGSNLGQRIQNLALAIIKLICSYKEDIELALIPTGRIGILKIRVNRSDMPRVLGASGANIKALTNLMDVIGERFRVPIKTQLDEPVKGERTPAAPFRPSDKWPKDEVGKVLAEAAALSFELPVSITVKNGKDFSSTFTIRLDEAEPLSKVDLLAESFSALWNIIGKANSRIIYVDIIHPTLDNPLNKLL